MKGKKDGATGAAQKRTTLPRMCDFTRQFLKDWKRLNDSGRFDLVKLKEVLILLIANDAPLPAHFATMN